MAASPNSLQGSTLSSAQIDAVTLLAAGHSIISVSQQAGVHRATIHNWLKLPEFRAAVDESRSEFIACMQAKLREIAGLAVDTIRQTLTDPEVSPAIKLRAALAVLDRPLFPKPVDSLPQETERQGPASPQPRQFKASYPVGTEIPRNSLCPCGSGNKYKRCCGTGAPPVLGRAA